MTAAATALEATAAAGQHHGHFPGSRLPGWARADRRSIPDADVQRGPLRSVTAIPSAHARPGTADSGRSGCRARCRASSSTCRHQRDERLRLALWAVGDRHPCPGARSSIRSEPAQVTSPVGPMIRRAPTILYTYIYYYIYCKLHNYRKLHNAKHGSGCPVGAAWDAAGRHHPVYRTPPEPRDCPVLATRCARGGRNPALAPQVHRARYTDGKRAHLVDCSGPGCC